MSLLKKPFFVFIALFLILSCGGGDDNPSPTDDNPVVIVDDDSDSIDNNDELEPQEGNIAINIEVILPGGSQISQDEIAVSSLFNTDNNSTDGFELEMYDTNGLELVVVNTLNDDLFMLGYVQPNTQDTFEINAESTALASILFHPWAVEYNSDEKTAIMEEIKALTEYQEYFDKVSLNILDGSPLNVEGREKVIEAFLSGNANKQNTIVKDEDVIEIEVNESRVKVTKTNSAAHYGIGLYSQSNPNTPFNDRLVLKKSTEEIEIPIPLDGQWDVNVKNGLVFDGSVENQFALISNSSEIIKSILTLYSSVLSEGIDSGNCVFDTFFVPAIVPSSSLYATWQQFSSNQISDLELIRQVTAYAIGRENDFWNVIKTCVSPNFNESFGSKALSKIFGLLSFVNDAYDGYQVTKSLILNKNSVELCFVKKGTDISFCNGISLGGVLEFGRIPIGLSSTERTLVISNNLEIEVDINEIQLPEGFESDPKVNERLILEPNGDLTLKITYTPSKIADIDTDVIVVNTADQENNKIRITGRGVNPLKSDVTELDFGSVAVNSESEPKSITLRNDSDVEITLNEVSSLDGYEFSIPEQTIAPDESTIIPVIFKPTDDFEDYNRELVFKTNSDQEDLVVQLRGDGIKGLTLEVFSEPKDLNFGRVSIDSQTGETKNLRISNPTDIPITINFFEFTGGAQGGYTTSLDNEIGNGLEMAAGTSRDFTITFRPNSERKYDGEFVVNNTESNDAPVSLPITGEGVAAQLTVSPDFIDFGEVEEGMMANRTFQLTNNLLESANITITTGNPEVTIVNWTNGNTLSVGQSVMITARFTPGASTTSVNNSITIEATNLSGAGETVNYVGSKGDSNSNSSLLNLLQSRGWSVFTDNSIIQGNCRTSYTQTCTINGETTNNSDDYESPCPSGYSNIGFNENGTLSHPFFQSNDPNITISTSYSVSGNNLSMQVNYVLNVEGSSQNQTLTWSGSYNENDNYFVLSFTDDLTSISNFETGGSCNSNTVQTANMIMR